MTRCGITQPGPSGPWHWLCVQDDCNGVNHYLISIADEGTSA